MKEHLTVCFIRVEDGEFDLFETIMEEFDCDRWWGRWDGTDNGEFQVYDYEQDQLHSITETDLLSGISMYMTGWAPGYSNQFPIRFENGVIDLGSIDKVIADCIVQFACFGDLVYG